MRVTVAAVGRMRETVFRDLWQHYADRLAWDLDVREIPVGTGRNGASRRRAEAGALLAAIPKGARTIALDENGSAVSSPALAEWIGRHRDAGMRHLCVVIGGPDGLDQAVLRQVEFTLSFGRVTWPHLLVRGMLAEQLYRAERILAGHPYHHA